MHSIIGMESMFINVERNIVLAYALHDEDLLHKVTQITNQIL